MRNPSNFFPFFSQLQIQGQASFPERVLNDLGYNLMAAGRLDDAVGIFSRNLTSYPGSSNVYDSLGEAYLKRGDLDLAETNYQKSLELDAGNENAKKMLTQIASQKSAND